MADTVGLSLLLEANIQQFDTAMDHLEAGVNETTAAIGTLTGSAAALTGGLNSLSPVTGAAAAGITNLSTAVSTGQASFLGFTSSAGRATTGLGNLGGATNGAGAGVNNFTGTLNNARNVLDRTTTTINEAAGALNRLSPIPPAVAAGVTNLSRAVANGGANLNSFYTGYSASIRGLQTATQDVTGTVGRLPLATTAASLGINNLSRAVNSGAATLRGISVTAQYADRQIDHLATSTQRVVRPTVNANGALAGFNNIIRDAPFGIIGIGNNITQLADAFAQLQRQTGSSGAAFRALASSVFGPAGLLTIGLSTGISLWTVYSMKQQQAKSKTEEASKAFKSQSDILKETTRNINQHNAEAISEIAILTRLFNVASNEVRSRKDRLAALKELKSQTNGYLNDLKLETIQSDAARESLDKYNASLFNSALIKAYQGEVEELAKTYAFNKEQADKGHKAIEEFDAAVTRYKKNIADRKVSGKDLLDISDRDVKNSKNRAILVQQTNKFATAANAAYDQMLATGKKIADLQVAVNPFSKGSNTDTAGKTVASVLKDLNLELAAIDAQAALTGATFDNVAKDKITSLQKAFEDLIKLGLKPTSPEIQNIATQMNALGDKILGDTPIVTKLVQSLGKQVKTTKVKTLTPEELAKLLGIDGKSELQLAYKAKANAVFEETPGLINNKKAAAQFESKTVLVNDKTAAAKFAKNAGEMAAAAKREFAKNYIQWGNALDQDLGPAIVDLGGQLQAAVGQVAVGLGEAIGGLITGKNGLSSVFGGILGLMADFIVSFGKSLIEAATLRIIAEKTLLVNPYLALAAGIGAVAIGTALKNSIPAFADGGAVSGPTLAMVGDNPSGVEYMIPKEVLDRLRGGSGKLSGRLVAEGSQLVAVIERTQKETKRYK